LRSSDLRSYDTECLLTSGTGTFEKRRVSHSFSSNGLKISWAAIDFFISEVTGFNCFAELSYLAGLVAEFDLDIFLIGWSLWVLLVVFRLA
jgi:hypothetical protein